ncbi:MAG: glycosyltransferase [Betaproteobacteria bacterium]|nr:glycosyltransferase [Betaproteobacteria bacterium]
MVLPRISEPLLAVLMFLGSLMTVRRLHRNAPFDVINSMWLYPDSVAAGWIAKWLRIPMVPTALGCDVNRMLNEGGKRQQILSMLLGSKSITAVSEDLRGGMVTNGIPATRIATIPNGVNNSLFFLRDKSEARIGLGLPRECKIIVYVGRLSEEKGISTLIDAAGELRRRRDDFLLCLVGDGPLMGVLQSRVQTLEIESSVRFVGHQNHAAVANWLGACDVFCLPSLREGCPNVVIEALSSGRPVVASRVGGIPDMVGDATGILVKAQHVQGFTEALDTALTRNWDTKLIAESMEGATWRAAAENYFLAYGNAISTTRTANQGNDSSTKT